ncbi:chaplin [Streptomyces sp. PT12]|uniref:chaplin n=1 Tax=Streptomyces sp. PT12 TaxID=1510197 RepID=UPI000DE37A04|nr:chaplin [Streptomyces sp. PT12]RBM23872.1 hypothetical protein DEH69_00880 [Streptomyces sp. PT12]
MRQVTSKGLITVAAAGGLLTALSGGSAYADSDAAGAAAFSPGVASGNSVQVPVHVPVNACGNTVDVVGALNPTFGNNCVNASGGHGTGGGGAQAGGGAIGSPGVASGNSVQVPVDVPVNACGNTIDVIGLGNGTTGNACGNGGQAERPERPEEPGAPEPEEPEGPEEPDDEEPRTPPVSDDDPTPPRGRGGDPVESGDPVDTRPQLASTGSGLPMTGALPLGAGLLVGGYVLYRRGRLAARG